MQEHGEWGLLGLGVMGLGLAANLNDHGQAVVGSDPDPGARSRAAGEGIKTATDVGQLVAALARPRTVLLMVPAGRAVDDLLTELIGLLEPGDTVIDAGNSLYRDTIRRARQLEQRELCFLGVGVSGGAEGARHGPSIMAGGDPAAWRRVEQVLLSIAAQVEGHPCAAYLGPGGAGHFVKMVHNGIEYADMQLIAETQMLLGRGQGLDLDEQAAVFERWNGGPLGSYLTEITAEVLRARDEETGCHVMELIKDAAGHKGTGVWASIAALELGVAAPTMIEAVSARAVSALVELRRERGKRWRRPPVPPAVQQLSEQQLGEALYAGRLCAHAQGFDLMAAGSAAHDWDLDLATVARIWRGGCIIRSRLLESIVAAYGGSAGRGGLVDNEQYGQALASNVGALREVVSAASSGGLPVPCLASALAWLEASHSSRLPADLIQAQRDRFGAHGFERVDRAGRFHLDGTEG